MMEVGVTRRRGFLLWALVAVALLGIGLEIVALVLPLRLSFASAADIGANDARGMLETQQRAGKIGAPAPEIALKDLAGNTMRLSDFHGKPVLVNFWATWCVPCRTEMPAIDRKFRQYKDSKNFVVLGVDVQQDEGIDAVRRFVGEVGATFPILLDGDGSAEKAYNIQGLPTSFFVDRSGIIRDLHLGAMTEEYIERALQEIF